MQKLCRYPLRLSGNSYWLMALVKYPFFLLKNSFTLSFLNQTNMLVKTFGSAVYGVEAITITVEVNWMETGTGYLIVGLPDNAVKESLQRIESTIKAIGLDMKRTRIVVNLAPADIKKSGTPFDLPIAMGILAATKQIKNAEVIEHYLIMGELS